MPGARDSDELAEPLRTAVKTLEATGRVYLVSGKRSPQQQIELRKAHCGTSQYAIYEMPSGQCSPPTARPGSSKHETGEAADLGGDLPYAHQRAAELGIHFPVAGEDWHAESTRPTTSSTPGPIGAQGWGNPLPSATDAAAGVIDLARLVTDPETWKRLAAISIGGVLVALGIAMLSGSVALPST